MHYERAPRFRRLKRIVWRRLRSAALCRASLRYGGAREAVCGETAGLGKMAEEWHFTLGER